MDLEQEVNFDLDNEDYQSSVPDPLAPDPSLCPVLKDYKGEVKFTGNPGQSEDDLWSNICTLNPDRREDEGVIYNPELIGIDISNVRSWRSEFDCFGYLISLGYDKRGYMFALHLEPDGDIVIMAGCRYFSFDEAREHWVENPDALAKVDLGEKIARELGWIVLEPNITAGELACETTPTTTIIDFN